MFIYNYSKEKLVNPCVHKQYTYYQPNYQEIYKKLQEDPLCIFKPIKSQNFPINPCVHKQQNYYQPDYSKIFKK